MSAHCGFWGPAEFSNLDGGGGLESQSINRLWRQVIVHDGGSCQLLTHPGGSSPRMIYPNFLTFVSTARIAYDT